MLLFDEDDFGVGGQQVDDTEITTTILYFSKTELVAFKKLCKAGIKQMFGQEHQQKGNLSDFLLTLLNTHYGSKENNSAPENDGSAGGRAVSEVSGQQGV